MAPDPEREIHPAAERRDRLRALRAAAELAVNPDVEQPDEEEDEHDGVVVDGEPQQQEQVVSFRNYLPRDEDLQQNKKTPVPLAKFEDPVTRTDVDERRQEDPIVSIAPKKPNWDLRRDVAKKLEKLERRTQRAIVELMQEEEKMRQVANERRDEVIDAEQICEDLVFPMERREPLLPEDVNSSSGAETSAAAVSLMDGLSLDIEGLNMHHQIALDQTIWSSLPEHLVDCILAWLPVDCFFRVRSVCKRWNRLMYSKPYLDSLSRVASQGLYVLMFTGFSQHQVGAAYNPALNRWHGIPFSYFLSCPNTGPVNVLATSGGLMCLQGMGTQLHTLYVSNPMRKEQRKLPPMLYMKSPYVLGMVVQRDKKGYKIVVAQDGDFVSSQVYDSRSNSWSMTGTLHRRSALVCGGTFLDGYLYCTTYGPHGIVCFNLEKGTWHDTEIPLPPSLTTCDLLERRGSLIMVGGIEKYGLLDSVRVWQLDIVRKTCVEVRRMPDRFFRMLFQSAGFHFLCVGHEDLICFHETHSRSTLMYDFGKDLWKWLPNCTLQHLESRGLLGVIFQPRLDTFV